MLISRLAESNYQQFYAMIRIPLEVLLMDSEVGNLYFDQFQNTLKSLTHHQTPSIVVILLNFHNAKFLRQNFPPEICNCII